MLRISVLAVCVLGVACQQAGTAKQEKHPELTVKSCTKASGCTAEQGSVVIDANWRWIHNVGGYTNCYTGSGWSPELCPDVATCAKNCAVEGVSDGYKSTYGVDATDAELKLNYVTGGNVGSRLFLLEDEETYKLFKLKNKEIAFDVDVSKLPCGLNGALYLVQMDADGGMSRFPGNKAGAKFGTGYCDAQCPHGIKFINGEPNILDWDPKAGTGRYGTCCTEMDLWEANSISTAYTAHACSVTDQTRCEGTDCGGEGVCDRNGCDFQTFRLGQQDYFGPGSNFTIDTRKPIRVVTQFITADGTDTGPLKEIRRFYRQGEKVIQSPKLAVGGAGKFDSISKDYCEAEVGLFKDGTTFLEKGGLEAMDAALEKGMVLTLSLWDDSAVHMLWLDSNYPVDQPTSKPGVARGTCATTSGVPADVRSQHPDAYVRYFNIHYGELGSTDTPSPSPSPSPAPTPSPPAPTPSPSPGAGKCCWGSSCASATDCHHDAFCSASEAHCTGNCAGIWCASEGYMV